MKPRKVISAPEIPEGYVVVYIDMKDEGLQRVGTPWWWGKMGVVPDPGTWPENAELAINPADFAKIFPNRPKKKVH